MSVNLLHLAITGLPGSGKSELLRHMLNLNQSQPDLQLRGRPSSVNDTSEVVVLCYDEISGSHAFITSTEEDFGVQVISSAVTQDLVRVHNSPSITSEESGMVFSDAMFPDRNVNKHFKAVVCHVEKLYGQLEGKGSLADMLKTGSLSFINVANTGVSRIAQEVFYTIASHCRSQILLHLLNLERDIPENFIVPPNFYDHEPPISGIKPAKIVKLQSALQDFKRAMYISSKACMSNSLVVMGTHKDKLTEGKLSQTKSYVEQIVLGSAENAGVVECVHPEIKCINTIDESDCQHVQKQLFQIVHQKHNFQCDVPLRFIFLRSYLHSSKRMFISRKKLVEEARKCGFTSEEEIEHFLAIYNNCGSIMYSDNGEFPILKDYIILNPFQFINAIDKLQQIDAKLFNNNPELFQDVEMTRLGFLSQKLAVHLWPEEGEGKMSQAHFLISVLKQFRFALPTKDLHLDSDDLNIDEGKLCHYMPSLRPDFDTTEPKGDANSLFVTYNDAVLPFNFSTDVILHLINHFGGTITYTPKPFYNTVSFKWHDTQEQRDADVIVRFHTEHLEVSVKFLSQAPRMSTVTTIFSQLKSACIELFEQLSSKIEEVNYEFAVICPYGNESSSHTRKMASPLSSKKVHFVSFNPFSTEEKKLYCKTCKDIVSSDKLPWARLLWTQVAYHGPSNSVLNQNSMFITI